MEWKFVTPTAAHHNGCAESLIRVTKAALKKSIGDQVLAPLECQTVLFDEDGIKMFFHPWFPDGSGILNVEMFR